MDTTANSLKTGNRIYYLDVLRMIACLAVIMIHTSATYVIAEFTSANFWLGNVLDSISRIGVPLFVMISGALLLDENKSYSNKKIIDHIVKMIIFFIFWSIVYCLVFKIFIPLLKGNSLSITSILYSLIIGNYHLWFCFMIVGLYLITPLLRLWIKKKNVNYVRYFLILALIFTFIIPEIIQVGTYYTGLFSYANKIMDYVNLKYVGGYTSYFILGWYLHNFTFKNLRFVYVAGVIGFVMSLIGTYILSNTLSTATQLYGNTTINVLAQSMFVFLFIKNKCNSDSDETSSIQKCVKFISKNSLGVYAIHAGVASIGYMFVDYFHFTNAFIIIPIIYFLALSISLALSWLMHKVPLLKNLV